jgi:xylulose-5-phosphate/fructose-6-phosphate phosphoketolase
LTGRRTPLDRRLLARGQLPLSVGQIYLLDNPLLRRPLEAGDVKPRLLGHWGTTPGLNLIYAHMNREIKPATSTASTSSARPRRPRHRREHLPRGQLQRVLPEHHPGRRRHPKAVPPVLVPRRHSEPRRPETPGSIHEGGELGYSLSHAYGAAFDNPDLLVCCVVGDGEAETGPLATGWHSNKFLDPKGDGAVLPILHLNGYKIANPTVLARIPQTSCAT